MHFLQYSDLLFPVSKISGDQKNVFFGTTSLLEIHNRIPTKVPGGLDPIDITVELK